MPHFKNLTTESFFQVISGCYYSMEETLENILMDCLPLSEFECRLSRYGRGHIFAIGYYEIPILQDMFFIILQSNNCFNHESVICHFCQYVDHIQLSNLFQNPLYRSLFVVPHVVNLVFLRV